MARRDKEEVGKPKCVTTELQTEGEAAGRLDVSRYLLGCPNKSMVLPAECHLQMAGVAVLGGICRLPSMISRVRPLTRSYRSRTNSVAAMTPIMPAGKVSQFSPAGSCMNARGSVQCPVTFLKA